MATTVEKPTKQFYFKVAVFKPLDKPLSYMWQQPLEIGALVLVPLGRRYETGIIVEIEKNAPTGSYKIKSLKNNI